MADTAQLALALYDLTGGATSWREPLAAIAHAASADEAAVFSAAPGARVLSSFEHGCLDRTVHESYVKEYASLDAQMLRVFDAGDGVAVSGADLMSADELKRCRVHNEYIIPNDIGAQIVWFFRTADGRGHTLALLRSVRAGAFSDDARRLGEVLLPHLRRVLDVIEHARPVRARPEPVRSLVIDTRGRIVWASAGAELMLKDGSLPTEGAALARPNHGALGYAETLRGERDEAAISWHGLTAQIHALRVTTASRLGLKEGQSGGLVFLQSEDHSQPLSRRERECLVWVARGERTARIADRLDLTERTVNQYLNSAMRKLGARTRAEAAVKAVRSGLIFP